MHIIFKNRHNSQIRIRKEDRYVSATDMAKVCNKLFADWNRLKSTSQYLQALESVMGIPITDLIQVIQGGVPTEQGTWLHPKVALRFAQWCSSEFAVQVDFWLDELLTTGKVELNQPKKNIYAHRVQIASQWDIPKGHWCVFHEISLLANKVGEQYAVQEYDLIDGSVGKCWANYRKTQPWALPHTTFNVVFNDSRDIAHVEANAYRNEELFYFRDWLESIYRATNMPKYLLKKYGAIIKA